MGKNWKDHLLKSGVPLEYEVKEILREFGCVGHAEYTYFRRDENDVSNEFSYDLDYSYIKGGHFVDLMVECKYRHLSTKWVFLPEDYGGMDEIERFHFLNPMDHFNKSLKFQHSFTYPHTLAPLCSNGIELLTNGFNSKSIKQAKSQLSYAFAEKLVSGFEHQIHSWLGDNEHIYYHIPIIITTSKLFRLNNDISMGDIKNSSDTSEVATEEDILILKSNTGRHLENYNKSVFSKFINEYGKHFLNEKVNSFNEDVEFVLSVIAKNYCPTALVVLKHNSDSYKRLFDFVDEIINPSKETVELINMSIREIDEMSKKLFSDKNGKE